MHTPIEARASKTPSKRVREPHTQAEGREGKTYHVHVGCPGQEVVNHLVLDRWVVNEGRAVLVVDDERTELGHLVFDAGGNGVVVGAEEAQPVDIADKVNQQRADTLRRLHVERLPIRSKKSRSIEMACSMKWLNGLCGFARSFSKKCVTIDRRCFSRIGNSIMFSSISSASFTPSRIGRSWATSRSTIS
jgi:hypothetical protein